MYQPDTVLSLVRSAQGLARMAALSTGNSTPAAEWRTLSILKTEGPMRIGALATASRVSQPGMTRLLAGLVESELVARVADSADSRAWLVRLTPKGESALLAWYAEVGDALQPVFDELDAEDWRHLARTAEILEAVTRIPMSDQARQKALA